MRILMLADRRFAQRELPMLRRVEIGLIGVGHRVALGLPDRLPITHGRSFTESVQYLSTGGRLTLGLRAQELVERIASSELLGPPIPVEGGAPVEGAIDVVHIHGIEAWRLGVLCAKHAQADVLIECVCQADIAAAPAFTTWANHHIDGHRIAWLTPCGSMTKHLKQSGTTWPIIECLWGVHAPDEPRNRHQPPQAITNQTTNSVIASHDAQHELAKEAPAQSTDSSTAMETNQAQSPTVIALTGRDDIAAACTAIEAVADLMDDGLNLLLMIEERVASASRKVWRTAQQRDILPQTIVLPTVDGHLGLVMGADVLLVADAGGHHRSSLLELMAAGTPIIARTDPRVGWLIDNTTAALINDPSQETWRDTLTRLLTDPVRAESLGKRAREHVQKYHVASKQIVSLLDIYEQLENPGPISISAESV